MIFLKKVFSIKFLIVGSIERTLMVKVGAMDFHMHKQGCKEGGWGVRIAFLVLPGIFLAGGPEPMTENFG